MSNGYEILIPGTWNARDVGGRAVPAGGSTPLAPGVLFRTASLSELHQDGIAVLDRLDVRTVLDLRRDEELERAGSDIVPEGTSVIRLPFGGTGDPNPKADPADAEADTSDATADMESMLEQFAGASPQIDPEVLAEHGRELMRQVYRDFITDKAAHAAVLGSLTTIAESSHAVSIHCSAGKDRTGWIVALVQTICGVSPDDVMDEYLLSRAAALQLRASLPPVPGVPPEVWEPMLAVEPDYLGTAWTTLDQTYGTLGEYFEQCGVDNSVLESLRARFGVVGKPAVHSLSS